MKLEQYKIIYTYNNRLADYLTRAEDGFDAERNFLIWAKDLPGAIKVERVERVVI